MGGKLKLMLPVPLFPFGCKMHFCTQVCIICMHNNMKSTFSVACILANHAFSHAMFNSQFWCETLNSLSQLYNLCAFTKIPIQNCGSRTNLMHHTIVCSVHSEQMKACQLKVITGLANLLQTTRSCCPFLSDETAL